ncbi:Transcriptional regulatory protein sin3 [Apophysomyces sp. BC1021]|nr:Transcriptional regulatory protein sin3 [Apophysomyces sp. BC1021]
MGFSSPIHSTMAEPIAAVSALRTTIPVPESSVTSKPEIPQRQTPSSSSHIDSLSDPSCDLQRKTSDSPLYPPLTCEELGYRPLNVSEALAYLDRVKLQLAGCPDNYEEFLDIMRDFKSDDVNVSGVVQRITHLFRDHPALIAGFNAFLPPGYRIDCVEEKVQDVVQDTTMASETCSAPPLSPNSSHYSIYSLYNDALQKQSKHYSSYAPHREPVQFTCAISFINKIKSRFSDNENKYAKFMSILKSYMTWETQIEEVRAQVQELFQGSSDILEEFEQFLPQNFHQYPSELTTSYMRLSDARIIKKSSIPEKSDEQEKKKRFTGPSTSDIPKAAKKIKTVHSMDNEDISSLRSEMFFDDLLDSTITMEESEFFDRIEMHIGNKATYDAFLKILNSFSQRIIDRNTLVDRAESFLGGDEALFSCFKEYVGYSDTERSTLPLLPNKPDTAPSKACGPSYRLVPRSWQNQRCSGRDPLCWDVLNDEYVSHPTWASEDSGFVSSKKSQFEEMLHRIEDERHEYDMTIEANLNTITLLEEIEEQLSTLTVEDKEDVCLLPDLGGAPRTIYQRTIRKAFGKEKCSEIIDHLHNKPVQTVPILIKRLKQKDEDWKREQLERNKVWRDIEMKNYYKALDYRCISFRYNDKKATSRKTLINEIQALQLEQQQKHENIFSLWRTDPQYTFFFTDRDIFKDISRLLFVFLERQPTYNTEECCRMRSFIESFLRRIFVDIAYERLLKMKMLDVEYQKNPRKAKKENKAELQLDIRNKRYHAVPMDFSRGYYNALLHLIESFFTGGTDPPVFEECSRYIFGTHSYTMFTIDKLIASIARQVNHIVTESKPRSLMELFKRTRGLLSTYVLTAQEIIEPGENLYHIAYDPENQSLSIQLLGEDEEIFESGRDDGYNEYIISYSNWSIETAGIDQSALARSFLRRNIRHSMRELKDEAYYMYSGLRTWLESDTGWRRGIQNAHESESNARELLANGQQEEY